MTVPANAASTFVMPRTSTRKLTSSYALAENASARAAPFRLVGEQVGIVHLQHAAARAGRRHDVVVRLERRDHLPGDRARVLPVAGVVGRLAAAGLRRRHLDPAAGRLEQLHRGEADARAEEVDEAGDEQADRGPVAPLACGFAFRYRHGCIAHRLSASAEVPVAPVEIAVSANDRSSRA